MFEEKEKPTFDGFTSSNIKCKKEDHCICINIYVKCEKDQP